jgi:hypothetical protein
VISIYSLDACLARIAAAKLKCSGAATGLGLADGAMCEGFFLSIVLRGGEKRVNLAAAGHQSSSGDLTSVIDRIGG